MTQRDWQRSMRILVWALTGYEKDGRGQHRSPALLKLVIDSLKVILEAPAARFLAAVNFQAGGDL